MARGWGARSGAAAPAEAGESGATAGTGARGKALLWTVLAGVALWLLPTPAGVEPRGWHLLAIFTATILGIMIQPLPMGAVAVLGITAAVLTGTLPIGDVMSGYGEPIIWLIVAAFFIAGGFLKTGLGMRIAYGFLAALGRTTLGLAYGLLATDLVLAPAIPSNTARAGGVIFPIVRSLGKAAGSEPGQGTERRMGAFLIMTAYHGTLITSAMFVTAMAGNPLAVALAGQQGIRVTWGTWATAGLVPGLFSLILIPLLLYRVYPPERRESPDAPVAARAQLRAMGPMRRPEWIMLGVFLLVLVLWIFGSSLGVDSTTAALVGLGVLLLTGALTWDDVLGEKAAWDTFIWIGALVMMASYLGDLGVTSWFSERVGAMMGGIGWVPAFLGLSLVYFFSHYFFASQTAHISAMYAPFLAVALAVGTPPILAALVLGYFGNLFSSLTHYATGPAPIFFGSGYVGLGTWWKLGLLVSVVNIVIWLGVGSLWWKLLGLW